MKNKILIFFTFIIFAITIYLLNGFSTKVIAQGNPYEAKLLSTMDILAEQSITNHSATGEFSHTLIDGCDFHCRNIRANKPSNSVTAENLYLGPCDINNAFSLFEKSPSHKANIDHGYPYSQMYQTKIDDICLYVFIYAEFKSL